MHMKQQPSDNYSIAWFKLAEFVTRGEKERAMGLYRLLAHSFEDQAIAHQLEGDLLRSFEDETAINCYECAALAYKANGRDMEAVAVYEHLLLLHPDEKLYRKAAVALYTTLGMPERAELHQLYLD